MSCYYEVVPAFEAWQHPNERPGAWAVRRQGSHEIVSWHGSYFAASFDAERRKRADDAVVRDPDAWAAVAKACK